MRTRISTHTGTDNQEGVLARIEAWEQRIRDQTESLARQLNDAPGYSLLTHHTAHSDKPDAIPPANPDAPNWWKRLVPVARKHFEVFRAITAALIADEDEDEAAIDEAMSQLADFIEGLRVGVEWTKNLGEYRVAMQFGADTEERHPFATTSMVLAFFDYWSRHREIVHLGVCRQCGTVYLKAKHGRKTRYCSSACRQRAFRERHKE